MKLNIRRQKKEIEFEEIFFDKYTKQKQAQNANTNTQLETPISKANFIVLFLLGVIIFGSFLF